MELFRNYPNNGQFSLFYNLLIGHLLLLFNHKIPFLQFFQWVFFVCYVFLLFIDSNVSLSITVSFPWASLLSHNYSARLTLHHQQILELQVWQLTWAEEVMTWQTRMFWTFQHALKNHKGFFSTPYPFFEYQYPQQFSEENN